jgi:hypothetical protein
MPQGRPYAIAGLLPGINEVAASTRPPAPKPHSWVTHALDLDIGEVGTGGQTGREHCSWQAGYVDREAY